MIEKLSKHFGRLNDVGITSTQNLMILCADNTAVQDDDTGPETPFETIEARPVLDTGGDETLG